MSDKRDCYKVWSRFEVKRKDGSVINLRIQDLPIDRIDDAVEFSANIFLKEEAINVAAGTFKNKEAVKESKEEERSFLESENVSAVICCVDDSDTPGEIIGLSCMELVKNTDDLKYDELEDNEAKTEEMKNVNKAIHVLEDYIDEQAFETCYADRGILVHPDYRGLGLANEFLKARRLICMDQKVPIVYAWMTSIATQKAGDRNNWKTIAEISIEELEKKTGLKFEQNLPSFKLMYTSINY